MKVSLRVVAMLALAVGIQAGSDWLTDPIKAKETAQKENKFVFVEFTGSDWCPPCKKLKGSILETDVFKEYVKKRLVLLELDFPKFTEQPAQLKEQNRRLQQRFRVTGFPTVVILDKNSKELARWSGFGGDTPEGYIAKIEAAVTKPVAASAGEQ